MSLEIDNLIEGASKGGQRPAGKVVRFHYEGADYALKTYAPVGLSARRALHNLASVWRGELPVEDTRSIERRDFERSVLALWTKYGFRVPEEARLPIRESVARPVLVTKWIEGPTLGEALSAGGAALDAKFKVVAEVLADMFRRHNVACELGEPRLVHFDCNTGNIILSPEGPVHIDFEMGRLWAPVKRSAGEELAKFLRWAARDIGRTSLGAVASLAVGPYSTRRDIVDGIIERALGRRFSFWHERRDRAKHAADPRDVTIMDVARALEEAIGNRRP
jgi:hypothetical protein